MALLLDPARVASAPWRNGAGSTRELAVETAAGHTLWRVSVADLDADAEFSVFPGLDRLFVPLGPLRLSVDGIERAVAAGERVRFAGELPVRVGVAAPIRALNVMTRRGRLRAAVELRDYNDPAAPGADLSVLLGELVADVRLTKDLP